jgi:arylsulfatase
MRIAVLALMQTCAGFAAADRSPNVVVMLADDLGFSDLGCYGGEIATPNLDALAQGGARFSQFYNTARCWPTRAALLTGYYAQQVGRDGFPGVKGKGKGGVQGSRPAWAKLLPARLQAAGYRSYHSGKWHLDGKPLANGFDRSYSLDDHDRHFYPKQHTRDDKPLPAVLPGAHYYSSSDIADHAIACLREHRRSYADKPFFSYVAFTAPHFPLHAPAEDVARYRDRYLAGWEAARAARWGRIRGLPISGASLSPVERDLGPPYKRPNDWALLGPGEAPLPIPWTELSEEQRRFQAGKMAVHAAMVDRMDREIGRIVAEVRAMDALDDTLICFLSDNGASAEIMVRGDGHDRDAPAGDGKTFLCLGPGWSSVANAPFRRHKTWVHEGGVATPFVVHWPKTIRDPGGWRSRPGHVVDFVPTILSAVGPKELRDQKAPPFPGENLLPTLKKDDPRRASPIWWLHEGNMAYRAGDWKIVAAKNQPWELYDLSKDRSETTNLADKHPDKLRELVAEWRKRTDEIAAAATSP